MQNLKEIKKIALYHDNITKSIYIESNELYHTLEVYSK